MKTTVTRCDKCNKVIPSRGEINSVSIIIQNANEYTFRNRLDLCGECGSIILKLATKRLEAPSTLKAILGD